MSNGLPTDDSTYLSWSCKIPDRIIRIRIIRIRIIRIIIHVRRCGFTAVPFGADGCAAWPNATSLICGNQLSQH